MVVWQVHWAEDDGDGRPVLVVHLEAALEQDAVGAATAAEAILAHMESALQRRFDDAPGRPEQLVVVLDSRGASTLQVLGIRHRLSHSPLDGSLLLHCSCWYQTLAPLEAGWDRSVAKSFSAGRGLV